ncbi:hypothetical protein [Streptomyces sp. NBC_00503]|uniref:hypothetical protein n=1 Tax=Streptomyces sp. NBC_00503 TaxID=2903659 RepID=UPI002E7FF650|nr:hypothetical protein [Streptomyces sp. NBC_00503]WUD81907.1 hypothetical protein OG490_15930 [Streptomyces sp. NBC_00503]
MRARAHVRRLLAAMAAVTAVTAATTVLAGCSAEPASSAPNTHVSFKPQPSTPTTPEPTRTGSAVIQWYGTGGVDLLNNLIASTRSVRGQHEQHAVFIDFAHVSTDLKAARAGGSIPDAEAQKAWWSALDRIDAATTAILVRSGLSLQEVPVGTTVQSEDEAWEGIGLALTDLKDTETRLHDLGCLPKGKPWG